MGILKFIVRRLLFGVFTLFIVSVAVFLLTQALSDPARAILGREATPESVLAKQQELGLDRPIITQYWDWFSGLLTGDPGTSFTNGLPVMDVLGDRLWNSLFLMADRRGDLHPAVDRHRRYAAARRDKAFDSASSGTSLVLASMPEFIARAAARRAAGHERVARLSGRHPDPAGRPAVVRHRRPRPPGADADARRHPIRVPRDAGVDDRGAGERLRRDGPAEGAAGADGAVAPRRPQRPRPDVAGDRASTSPTSPAGSSSSRSSSTTPASGRAARRRPRPQRAGRAVHRHLIAGIWVVVNMLADIGTVLVTPRLRTQLR